MCPVVTLPRNQGAPCTKPCSVGWDVKTCTHSKVALFSILTSSKWSQICHGSHICTVFIELSQTLFIFLPCGHGDSYWQMQCERHSRYGFQLTLVSQYCALSRLAQWLWGAALAFWFTSLSWCSQFEGDVAEEGFLCCQKSAGGLNLSSLSCADCPLLISCINTRC